MTGRPRFGDFALLARRRLAVASRRIPPNWRPNAVEAAIAADDYVTGPHKILKTMGRYLADITTATTPRRGVPASPWHRAASEAREAWQNAYCSLPVSSFINLEQPQRGLPRPVNRELEAVAYTMAVGRELLHTHQP